MISIPKKLLLCCLAASSFAACAVDPDHDIGGAADPQATPDVAARKDPGVSPNGDLNGQSAITPRAVAGTACFQHNNPNGGTWFIQASINLDAYPYAITGGSIVGTICDSPNWALTGGSVGNSLTINGTHTGAGSCAGTVTIIAPANSPNSYPGTYGFDGANNSFTHRTLFLGFNRSCP
jgi:hypothetical protein